MVKALIFDFFDVIRTDPFKSWLTLNKYSLEGDFLEANQQLDRGQITQEDFLKRLGAITNRDAQEIFDEMEAGAALDYDMLAFINNLHARYKIGLLSNSPSNFLRSLLRDHNIENYFDAIIVSSEVGLIKPQPEIFKHALEALAVKAAEAIFIDDNPQNIKGGEAVGIPGIIYHNLGQLKTDLLARGVQF